MHVYIYRIESAVFTTSVRGITTYPDVKLKDHNYSCLQNGAILFHFNDLYIKYVSNMDRYIYVNPTFI